MDLCIAWRRKKSSRPGAWEKTTIPPGTRGAVFQAVCDLELAASDEWEYVVTPEGKYPGDGPEWTRKGRIGF